MKKIVSIILVLTLVFALAACNMNKTTDENSGDTGNNEVSAVDDVENSDVVEEADTTAEWKQFLKDYEEWADKYIEILKKYKNNPTDMSILSDYTEMMTELAEWTTKTENMEKELDNASPEELAEYSAELARIAAKIAQASY